METGKEQRVSRKELESFKSGFTKLTGVNFVISVLAIGIAFTSVIISEKKTNEFVMLVRKETVYETIPTPTTNGLTTGHITSGAITSGAITSGAVTSGTFITTAGPISQDPATDFNISINPAEYIPYSVRLSSLYTNPGIDYLLEWSMDKTDYVGHYIVYQNNAPIYSGDLNDCTIYKSVALSIPVVASPFTGIQYFGVQAYLVDGSTTELSEELGFDTTVRVATYDDTTKELYLYNGLESYNSSLYVNVDAKLTGEYYKFSPDGTLLGYITQQNPALNATLKLYDVNTGVATAYTTSFSSGARHVYKFGFSRDSKKVFYICNCTSVGNELWVSRVNGSEPVMISSQYGSSGYGVYYGGRDYASPIFLPNGKGIVWAENTVANGFRIYYSVMNGTDVTTTRLDDMTSTASLSSFKLSDDGAYLVYISDPNATGIFNVHSVKLSDPGTSIKISPQFTSTFKISSALVTRYFITPQSDRVVFAVTNTSGSLGYYYSAPIGRSNAATLLTPDITTDNNLESHSAYSPISPDGQWIAYGIKTFTTNRCRLFLSSVRGYSQPIMIASVTYSSCSVDSWKWDPDGNVLIFAGTWVSGGTSALHSVNIDFMGAAGAVQEIHPTETPDIDISISITQDGKNVVYMAKEDNSWYEIYTGSIPGSSSSTRIISVSSGVALTSYTVTSVGRTTFGFLDE